MILLMKTYTQYPPRKMQSEVYTGPITLQQFERFKDIREMLEKEDINLPLPTGNQLPRGALQPGEPPSVFQHEG